MALPPLPPLVRLDGAVIVDGSRIVLRAPGGIYVRQAVLAGLLTPVAAGLITVLAVGMIGTHGRSLLVALGVGAAFALLLGALGVGRPLLLLARRPTTELDLAAGTWRQGSLSGALSEIRVVKAEQPNPLLSWKALRAHRTSGPPLVLLGDLPPGFPHELVALAEWMGAALGVTGLATQEVLVRDPFGGGDRTAAALCYLPFQGIYLLASLWYLFRGRDRPFVHQAARQSLAILAAWVPLVLLLVAVLAAAVFATERASGTVRGIATGIPIVLLSLAALAHLVLRLVLCVRAWRGRTTVLPLLGRFAGPRPEDLGRQ